MRDTQPSPSPASHGREAREDYSNSFTGLIRLARIIVNKESSPDAFAKVFIAAMVNSPDSTPTFKEYLKSGSGANLASGVSEATKTKIDQLSVELIKKIHQMNETPTDKALLAETFALVAKILPPRSPIGINLVKARIAILKGEGLSWGDALAKLGIEPSGMSQLKLPGRNL